jgi:hypothetical protein
MPRQPIHPEERFTGRLHLTDDAQRLVSGYVDHYNNTRLNSATA